MSDTYRIPKFIDEVKNAIIEKNRLRMQRQEYVARNFKGKVFFSDQQSHEDYGRGLQLMREIIDEISRIDDEIDLLEQRIVSILEAKVARVAFKIKTADHRLNSLEEEQSSQEVYVVPWHTIKGEERLELTVEELWAVRLAMKTFDVSIGNIEFISSDKNQDLFGEVEQRAKR